MNVVTPLQQDLQKFTNHAIMDNYSQEYWLKFVSMSGAVAGIVVFAAAKKVTKSNILSGVAGMAVAYMVGNYIRPA